MTLLAPVRHRVERAVWLATRGRIARVWARRSRGILALSTDLHAGIAMEPWAFMGIGHNGARKSRAARRRSYRAEQENRRRCTPVRSRGACRVPSRRIRATEAWWPGNRATGALKLGQRHPHKAAEAPGGPPVRAPWYLASCFGCVESGWVLARRPDRLSWPQSC